MVMEVINVLLLGKTGDGKSTIINSFANMIYKEFKEVRKEVLKIPIPVAYHLYEDDGIEKVLIIGENVDYNESLSTTGESGTRSCKSFKFVFKNLEINFIDSPGLADTEGREQDNINLENILKSINQFKNIHAIAIVLKPNEQKLTPEFTYCIHQLLNQFDATAIPNIVFLFTNSRSTHFQTGCSSMRLLKRMIAELEKDTKFQILCNDNNTFNFDNEWFQYVATKDEISSPEYNIISDYEFSYKKSRSEMFRFVSYLRGLPQSYDVEASISLFRVRRSLEVLLPQLRDYYLVLIQNEEEVETAIQEINNFQGGITELTNNLHISQFVVDRKRFNQPIIVCHSEKCKELLHTENGEESIHAKICYQSQISFLEVFQSLKKFLDSSKKVDGKSINAAITKWTGVDFVASSMCSPATFIASGATLFAWYLQRSCSICGCPNTSHYPQLYLQRKTKVVLEDKKIRQKIQKNKNTLQIKSNFIKYLEQKGSEIRDEKNWLEKAIVKFSVFLETRSLTSYKDPLHDEIKSLEEKYTCDDKNIWAKKLHQQAQQYLQAKELPTKLTNFEVNCILDQLLKHSKFGDMFQEILDVNFKNYLVRKDTIVELEDFEVLFS